MKEKILMDNPEFEEQFRELVGLEDVSYFYHVTPEDPEQICEEGLFLLENRLSSTTIEIPQEFIDDPITFSLGERGDGYRENASIILLGIPDENVKYAIEKNYVKPRSWNNIEFPEYVIPPTYIIGYIDTSTVELTLNEKYDLLEETPYI
ncbi:MAG: hypothetical protein GX758_04825 [Tenericutes bacterium]|nr:hypothetical protein [Mycoplasmatota bacterium]